MENNYYDGHKIAEEVKAVGDFINNARELHTLEWMKERDEAEEYPKCKECKDVNNCDIVKNKNKEARSKITLMALINSYYNYVMSGQSAFDHHPRNIELNVFVNDNCSKLGLKRYNFVKANGMGMLIDHYEKSEERIYIQDYAKLFTLSKLEVYI